MKILSLILSIIVFVGAGFFLIVDFRPSLEMNFLIYMSLLVILMMICVVGVLINYPILLKHKRNIKNFIYNSYSNKRILNKEFDRQFGIS